MIIPDDTISNFQVRQRCLWKPKLKRNRTIKENDTVHSDNAIDGNDDVHIDGIDTTEMDMDYVVEEPQYLVYDDIYSQFMKKKKRLPLFRYVSNSLVVVQEFSLSSYHVAWHRIMMIQEKRNHYEQSNVIFSHQQHYIDASMICMYVALLVAISFNSLAIKSINERSKMSRTTYYSSKVLYRILDASILATILRYVAALLHNLTASYSPDTVESLATTAIIIHILCCDYSYANGYQVKDVTTSPNPINVAIENVNQIDQSNDRQQHQGQPKHSVLISQHRSSFMGGTISLNAAFFATILLVSRFTESSSSTNVNSFTFVSLSVIVFAFYPITRHTISVVYPSHRSVVHWLITGTVIVSTLCLLAVLDETEQHQTTKQIPLLLFPPYSYTTLFLTIIMLLGIIFPIWKYSMAKYKVMLRGPWDIPTRDSMQIEYQWRFNANRISVATLKVACG